jgi:hypothetical protein
MSKIEHIIDDILNIDISQLNSEDREKAIVSANEAVVALEEMQLLVGEEDE